MKYIDEALELCEGSNEILSHYPDFNDVENEYHDADEFASGDIGF